MQERQTERIRVQVGRLDWRTGSFDRGKAFLLRRGKGLSVKDTRAPLQWGKRSGERWRKGCRKGEGGEGLIWKAAPLPGRRRTGEVERTTPFFSEKHSPAEGGGKFFNEGGGVISFLREERGGFRIITRPLRGKAQWSPRSNVGDEKTGIRAGCGCVYDNCSSNCYTKEERRKEYEGRKRTKDGKVRKHRRGKSAWICYSSQLTW